MKLEYYDTITKDLEIKTYTLETKLKNEIEILEKENAKLKATIAAFETRLSALENK